MQSNQRNRVFNRIWGLEPRIIVKNPVSRPHVSFESQKKRVLHFSHRR